jgi:hypothetical protein
MPLPLRPHHLTPAASLNRVTIADLPTVELEPDVCGKTAYELLSLQALTADIVRHVDDLALAAIAQADPARLPRALERCFQSQDPAICAAAEAVAHRFGRHLAYLIATLKRGDQANRDAREDWDDSYWAHWSRIRRIWLGGGLASGSFGQRVRHHAQALVTQIAGADCALHVAPAPSALPLIGATRSVPPESRAALVFDFGHSSIKRALAVYEAGSLVELHLLPALPVDMAVVRHHAAPAPEQVDPLVEYMAATMVDAWRDVQAPALVLTPLLVTSIASYVANNHPLTRPGGPDAQVPILRGNLSHSLAQSIRRQVGQAIAVELIHDGSAAARVYAGEPDAAVIMLGTALGIGFPPSAELLRPVHPRFTVHPVNQESTSA